MEVIEAERDNMQPWNGGEKIKNGMWVLICVGFGIALQW